jgi:hypothetical protein
MSEWYCMVQGRQYGPVDESTLKAWIIQGRCRPDDDVWTPGEQTWRPARDVLALADACRQAVSTPPPRPGKETPGAAAAALACGIGGMVMPCAGLILGIVAVSQAKKGMAIIREQPDRHSGEGFCTAGRILGIIAIIIGSLWALYFVVWVAFAVGMVAFGG